MKMKGRVSLVAGCMLVAYFSHTASAKTLTKADIEGKTVCFGGNVTNVFSAGGKVYNNIAGDGTWSQGCSTLSTESFMQQVSTN